MQAYMKSTMPYHGVRMPQVRAAAMSTFAKAEFKSCEEWRREVLAIWRGAKFREERYAAMVLAGDRRHAGCRAAESVPMFEEMMSPARGGTTWTRWRTSSATCCARTRASCVP